MANGLGTVGDEIVNDELDTSNSNGQVVDAGAEIKIHMVDFENKQDWLRFEAEIGAAISAGTYGAKTLNNVWEAYKHRAGLLSDAVDRITVTVARINGLRTGEQQAGDKRRSLRQAAEKFYASLSTGMLRAQCNILGVDYDSYESQEDIIDVLVTKHLQEVLG